jgi:hypothetical protein
MPFNSSVIRRQKDRKLINIIILNVILGIWLKSGIFFFLM